MGCTPYAPKWEIDVRWNSTYNMLFSCSRQRKSLQLFYDSIAKGKNGIKNSLWDLIEEFTDMLKVFKQSTTYLSGVYYPTSPLMARQLQMNYK